MNVCACLSCREKYSLEQDIREKEESIRQKTNEVQVKTLFIIISFHFNLIYGELRILSSIFPYVSSGQDFPPLREFSSSLQKDLYFPVLHQKCFLLMLVNINRR